MKNFELKNRFKSLLASLLFHVFLLTAFLFFGFKTPVSLAQEETVEIRLGDLEGMGSLDLIPPPASTPSHASNPVTTEEYLVLQNLEESTIVSKTLNPENSENNVKTETGQTVNNNMIFRPGDKSGHSQGNGNKTGYQGSPDGNPNATSPVGSHGNGVSFVLNGRSSKYLPKPEYNSPEQGTVVVAITVDREGKVIKAIAGAQGSTTTDGTLKKLATNAALKATFQANANAPEEQIGTITYKFIRLN